MPTRYLKPGIRDSEGLDAVEPQAEILFYRLLVTVDDFGRYDGRPALIRAACYPLKDFTLDQVTGWLGDLTLHGLITLYTVDGKTYLQIEKWDNKPRASESKYPAVADGCIRNADTAHTSDTQTYVESTLNRNREPKHKPETETETETKDAPPSGGLPDSDPCCFCCGLDGDACTCDPPPKPEPTRESSAIETRQAGEHVEASDDRLADRTPIGAELETPQDRKPGFESRSPAVLKPVPFKKTGAKYVRQIGTGQPPKAYSPEFEQFTWPMWKQTARSSHKRDAFKAWWRAVGRLSGMALFPWKDNAIEWLDSRIRAYVASPQGRSEFSPLLSTWLIGERYDDDDDSWQANGKPEKPRLPTPEENAAWRPH